jgi:hypothetical protein
MSGKCKSINRCKYPEIKDFLKRCGYFRNKPECSCEEVFPVYNPEWTDEILDNLMNIQRGMEVNNDIFQGILKVKDTGIAGLPKPLGNALKKYPESERKNILKLYKKIMENMGIPPEHDKRIWITIKDRTGYVDMRWNGKEIVEIYMPPPDWMTPQNGYYITCINSYPDTYSICDRSGIENNKISCVPFSQPMTQYGVGIGVCADFAIRTVLLTLLYKKAPTVPEISFKARHEILLGRQTRGSMGGMTAGEIDKLLSLYGYNNHNISHYEPQCENCRSILEQKLICPECDFDIKIPIPQHKDIIEWIYAYTESGLPTIIGVNDSSLLPWRKEKSGEKHAIVSIGHSLSTKNRLKELIVHDITSLPYQVLDVGEKGKRNIKNIEDAIAPVPSLVGVDYLSAKLSLQNMYLEEEIKTRPILLEASRAKQLLLGKIERKYLVNYSKPHKDLNKSHLPRFVWFFELKGEDNSYYGDVLVNAEKNEPNIIALNQPYKNTYMYRDMNWKMYVKKYK